ncbi:hypothetical protein RUM44_003174 [Polyplax serrata]|uniref:BHLH domain-containing protein n=1 Tax=Polyplax serrata TaxID=468196 RepID=A0ABR1AXV8_POLSC
MPRHRRSINQSIELVDEDDSSQKSEPEKPGQRNAANARERARMRILSKAFSRLKTTLPWVPPDTKLSKLDTLRLATSYIAHLRTILTDDGSPPPIVHPLNLEWAHLDSVAARALLRLWAQSCGPKFLPSYVQLLCYIPPQTWPFTIQPQQSEHSGRSPGDDWSSEEHQTVSNRTTTGRLDVIPAYLDSSTVCENQSRQFQHRSLHLADRRLHYSDSLLNIA